jgi:hypothetical protein
MPIHIDTKYINLLSPRLQRFQWKKQSLAVCRCPICGDSERSKAKARFYFYEKKGSFFCKCHNCDYGASLSWFLKSQDVNLHRQYTFEVLKETGERTGAHARTHGHTHAPARTHEDKVLSLIPTLESLPQSHPAVEWARKRKLPSAAMPLLRYTDDYGEWAKNIDPDVQAGNDARIVIPMLDRKGRVVGAQGRIVGSGKPDRNAIRYITVKADKDAAKAWYGMERCDPKKPVVVVEGPLDSLFLPNAVAMVGLSDALNIPDELKDAELIYALDNEPRNRQVVEAMERILEAGHRVCIWSDRFRGLKDINDMVLAGHTPVTIMQDITTNSHSGLSGHIALKRWTK